MAKTGRHSASALKTADGRAGQHGKTMLLLGIGAGAQVVLLVGVGAHGFGYHAGASQAIAENIRVPVRTQGPASAGAATPAATPPGIVAADHNAGSADPASEAGRSTSVLGSFLRASARGAKITAATVPGVTSLTTTGGDSGALPVIPFPNKPIIPPDPTPGPPVTTPTPPSSPTSKPTSTPTTAPPVTTPTPPPGPTAEPTTEPPDTTGPTPPGTPTLEPPGEPTAPQGPVETTPADPGPPQVPALPTPTVLDPPAPDPVPPATDPDLLPPAVDPVLAALGDLAG